MDMKARRQKTGGRRAGTPNRFTGAFREAVQIVYNDMGGHEAFTRWARKNQTEFYRIASRLIPVEIRETSDKTVNVIVHRSPQSITVESTKAITDRTGEAHHDGAYRLGSSPFFSKS